MPGPIPARDDSLARPRSRNGRNQMPTTKGIARKTVWPAPDPEWHQIAYMVWEGCQTSGQQDYYQQSDIAVLYSLCDDLSNYKQSGRRSSQMAQVIYSTMSTLLVTEGDRRRVRIELSEPAPEQAPASVSAIASYRADLDADTPTSEES